MVGLIGSSAPVTDYDPYADDNLLDPYPGYRNMQDLGPVVYLSRYNVYGLYRYKDVSAALSDWETFTSAQGVGLNDQINFALGARATVSTDPPDHDTMRRVLGRPLSAKALAALRDRVMAEAEALVERLVARGRFDAVTELACHLPLVIVSHLVGLPEQWRSNMLALSTATFDAAGPKGVRSDLALKTIADLGGFAFTKLPRDSFAPESWATQLFEAADREEITLEQAASMLIDYVIPSLDTTITAISNIIWLFANHPDQWETLRGRPDLIRNAINEAVRIESPLQGFTRCTTRDHLIDGVIIPRGARTLVAFGSANRDERKWGAPDLFNVERQPVDHVGFGYGVHRCVGANLATLEMTNLISALLHRVSKFQLDAAERQPNSMVRGWKSLVVQVI